MNDRVILDALIDQFGEHPDGLIWVGGHKDGWGGRCFDTPALASAYAYGLDRRGVAGDGVYVRGTTLRSIPTKVDEATGERKPGGRGEAADSATVYAFTTDLDIAGPGHKNPRYPLTLEEWKTVLAKANFPEPTRWDHSGGGYYASWQLVTPVSVRDDLVLQDIKALWAALAAHLIQVTKDAGKTDERPEGWKVDNVSDLSRVFRLPGTTNRKPEMSEPVTCTVMSTGGPRYTLDELRAVLPVKEEAAEPQLPEGEPGLWEGTDTTPAAPKLGQHSEREHDGNWTRQHATTEINKWVAKVANHRGKGYGFNEQLRDSAVRVGRFVPTFLSRADAEEKLLTAVSKVFGTPDINDKATIRSGLNKGETMPFKLIEDKPKGRARRRNTDEIETFGSIKLADLAEPAFRGRFRWCAQLGWLAHDGARWVPDNEPAALTALVGVIKAYTLELLAERPLGGEDYDELRGLSSGTTQNHALKILRGAPGIATVYTEFDALPKPGQPWTVPCANGITVELHADGRRTTRLTTAQDMNTKCAVAYDATATAPNIAAAFADYQPDEDVRRFKLQMWCRALSGLGAENFIVDLGAGGGNGKGTMQGLVDAVFADYSGELPVEAILKGHISARSEFRAELSELRGCRHIFCEEPAEGVAYDLGMLKKITGGGKLDGRAMRKDRVIFDAKWLFEMAANFRPAWHADKAMERRYVEVAWDYSIKAGKGELDDNFKDALKVEASGFLNAILAHWTGNAKPVPPAVVQVQTAKGAAESSPLAPFVVGEGGALVAAPGAKVAARSVFRAYERWAARSNVRGTMTETKFGRELPRFVRKDTDRLGTWYFDVEIKPEFDTGNFAQ